MEASEDQVEQHEGEMIAQAAQTSAEETADAIDVAAEVNEDPQVADALAVAALHADKTVSRVGWIRSFVTRVLHPAGS